MLSFVIYANIFIKCIKSFIIYVLIRIRDYQRILKSLVFCNRGLTFLTEEIARVCGDEATSTPCIISRSANGNAPAFRGDKSLDLQQCPISDP